ncbi:MAG: hypothetical protein KDD19_09830 [Phaeodactylibacter sp.]|nr:hypothetical protein [Phaeodactylibacter sp.]MCB9050442.1 hypothetical protein [Lewinellaceae bacterium]MCO6476808.1 hypothetical protein [Phaeodactylibacter sp.]
MENLIRQKLRELDQLKINLLQGLSSNDEPARAYRQMSLEVVEGCQAVLGQVVEDLKCMKKRSQG